MNHEDRLSNAIAAARRVEASDGAAELRRTGQGGEWTEADEANLRAGFMMIRNPRTGYPERINLPIIVAKDKR